MVVGMATCAMLAINLWLNWELSTARGLAEDHRWKDARSFLGRYLMFRPSDAKTRILMSHCLISDNSLTIQNVATEALNCLAAIPESSPQSATARIIEGRVYLLLLLQPARAEQKFQLALQSDPTRIDAHALLWKVYELTRRWHLCDKHFWQIYEHSQTAERANLLRDWYLSEFHPGSAIADLDRKLGILNADEKPSAAVERRRYEMFIAAEPDSPLGYACLAQWFHQNGLISKGQEAIKRAEQISGGSENPFVIATQVAISFELGEFNEAQEQFRHWPVDDKGFEYWKTKGLIDDQILRDNEQARDAYTHVLSTEFGKSEWMTHHRLAQILMRMNLRDEAAIMRNRSKELELQMEPNVHQPLREALAQPESIETQERMAQFYERIGRHRESSAWRELPHR